jgi:hypothetical protein
VKTSAAVATVVAVVAASAAVVITVVVITGRDIVVVAVVASVVGRSDAAAFVELVSSGFFGLDRGDAIFAGVAVMRCLSIFNQRRPTGNGRGGGPVLVDAGTNRPGLSHEVAVQRNERVESVVTLEIRKIGQHVKGVQVNQQIFVVARSMADSPGPAGSLESDFVTQIGRQSALDVIVRQIQRLVEQAFRLQPAALTEEQIRKLLSTRRVTC